MGQARLDALVGASEETSSRHRRRRVRKKPTKDLWYVLTDAGPKGPYAKDQIVQFARQGKINQANKLRNATSGAETRAGDVPGLFEKPAEKPAESEHKAEATAEHEWYVKTKTGQAGPFSGNEVIAFAKTGKINTATKLRKGHVGDFVEAGKIRGLFPETA